MPLEPVAHVRDDDLRAVDRVAEVLHGRVDVLRLLANGQNNREIAEQFGTSEGTVKNHCSNIFSKLGVRDRTRAVLRAIQLGVI